MRADRLVQLLLLLQRRGQITAAQAAGELEVSVRTARRDLEALSMSGVPVYSQAGRGGGWSLVGGSTMDLSGLTESESRALFLTASGASVSDPTLRAALRKVTHALPETFRAGAETATQSVMVDTDGWGHTSIGGSTKSEHFACISGALLDGVQVHMRYVNNQRIASERTVHPLGLVEKQGRWYFMADTAKGQRTFRLDRVTEATASDQPAVRPEGFDLERAWAEVNVGFAEFSLSTEASGWLVDAKMVFVLRARFGARLTEGEPDTDGRIPIVLRGWAPEALGRELCGFGAAVVIVEPAEVCAVLSQVGAELAGLYPEPRPD